MPKINVDSLFICPITGCLIEDPVSIDGDTTGQLYERKAIEYYFQNHDTLPHTQTLAKTKKLKTNHAARTAIKEILKKHHPCTLATFFEAVMSGQMETLHKINYLSSYCRAKNINHLTALQLATTKGFEAIVETLIADSDINACTPDGTTPLHIAANKGFLGIVEQLISAGAKLDAPDNLGRTPLHAAVLGEQDTVTQKLIAAGAPLEAKDTGGSTALHFTAAKCNVKVAAWLLEAGANLEAKTEAGTTPLFELSPGIAMHSYLFC